MIKDIINIEYDKFVYACTMTSLSKELTEMGDTDKKDFFSTFFNINFFQDISKKVSDEKKEKWRGEKREER